MHCTDLEYKFEVHHCKGSDNIVADFFSRNFPGRVGEMQESRVILNFVKVLGCERLTTPVKIRTVGVSEKRHRIVTTPRKEIPKYAVS